MIRLIEVVRPEVCLFGSTENGSDAEEETQAQEIIAKLRQMDVLTSQGESVSDAVRSIGVTEVTYYRSRQEFGVLKIDQVKRLKDLETENTRLRRPVSDLTLDKLILQLSREPTAHPRAVGQRLAASQVDVGEALASRNILGHTGLTSIADTLRTRPLGEKP